MGRKERNRVGRGNVLVNEIVEHELDLKVKKPKLTHVEALSVVLLLFL